MAGLVLLVEKRTVLKVTEAVKNFFTEPLSHFAEIVNLLKPIPVAIPSSHNSLLPRLYSNVSFYSMLTRSLFFCQTRT